MQPQSTETLVRVLIGLQCVAVVTVVAATFAAIVIDIPIYLAMLFLGSVGLGLLVTYSQHGHQAVMLFGLSALVFAVAYYICLYVLQLPLSPLYLFVLAYAVIALATGIWLLSRFKLGT